ncbi:MAG TPA: universal stress protein [Armatimonadota bacterium]|nr:universal stress protein [Armatimonadota bacterium]
MIRKLLVAYDGSEGANRALRTGLELAKAMGVDLHAVTIEEELPRYAATLDEIDAVKQQADSFYGQICREAEAIARGEGVTLHTNVIAGHEVASLVEYTKAHGFDVLLVGYHGRSAVTERLFGSTTASLVLHAPCSVLVVK